MHFPQITSENLARETFDLPGDFEGDLNLCLTAFQRWHQPLINSWVPLARQLEETHPGFRYYEFPVIRRLNALFRSFIDQGMRAGIPEPVARHKTITLYTDKAPFKQALEIDDEDEIHLRLVDREGVVHWHAPGALTEEAAEGLEKAVEQRLG
ncbi:MAG: hypothetical protein U9R72_05195 [Chloroflexota bacterium]|nr:hypothetical protein [Chloroflexota bacterium]